MSSPCFLQCGASFRKRVILSGTGRLRQRLRGKYFCVQPIFCVWSDRFVSDRRAWSALPLQLQGRSHSRNNRHRQMRSHREGEDAGTGPHVNGFSYENVWALSATWRKSAPQGRACQRLAACCERLSIAKPTSAENPVIPYARGADRRGRECSL